MNGAVTCIKGLSNIGDGHESDQPFVLFQTVSALILSMQVLLGHSLCMQTTKVMTSLHECAGWSMSLLLGHLLGPLKCMAA